MENLERKLKHYYENNFDYEPSDALAERLLALESGPMAAPKRRRRYVLPIAAALALALGLSGWAIFHSPKPEQTQVQAPETSQKVSVQVQNGADDQAELSKPAIPGKKKPEAPKQQAPVEEVPAPAQQPGQENISHSVPAAAPVLPAQAPPDDPLPEPPQPERPDETPVPPEDLPAVIPDEPAPPEPPEPDPPAEEQPQPDPTPEEPPQPDPTPEEPPQEERPEEPLIIHLEEEHGIDASYRMKGGRETLTLMSQSTGERVELDVTGWQEELQTPPATDVPPPEETPAQTEAATYSGRNSIVDFIFDKAIVFYLILEDDGTVRVKLDVAEN